MKRHLSDSEPELCDDYDEECSSPDTMQISRKKRRGIIEKRRRDRINNCLVELRRLVPAAFEKQGSAKLEKAEILQMTVDHLRHLQSRDPRGFSDPYSPYGNTRAFLDYGVMGFRECAAEIAHFLSNVEGVDAKEPLKMRMIGHLENLVSQKELAINAAMAANSQVGVPKVAAAAPAAAPQHLQAPVSVVSMPSVPAMSIPYAPLTPPRASPDNLSPPGGFSAVGEPLPRFSVAFPVPTTPIISFAPTTNGTMPTAAVFHPAPSGFKPVIPASVVQQPQQQGGGASAPISVVKPTPTALASMPRPPAVMTASSAASMARPLTVITSNASMAAANNSSTVSLSPVSPPPPPNAKTITMMVEATTSTMTFLPKSPTKMVTNSSKAPFRPWADSTDMTNDA